jgi:hypothetical protein
MDSMVHLKCGNEPVPRARISGNPVPSSPVAILARPAAAHGGRRLPTQRRRACPSAYSAPRTMSPL